MKRRGAVYELLTAAVVAAAFTAGAYQAWNGGAGTTLLSDPLNYTPKKSPIYGVEGGDSNLGGFPTGTYKLDADMTANRIVFDRTGSTAVFNLGAAYTLTLLGKDTSWAFGVTQAGSNSTMRLTSGTIRIPFEVEPGSPTTNCVMRIPREDTAHDFFFVVDGPSSVLKADYLYLSYGSRCGLSVVNGGYVTNDFVKLGSARAPGNVLTVDGVGSRLDAGGSITLDSGTCCGLVVTNGGCVAGPLFVGRSSSTSNSVIVSGAGSVYAFPSNSSFTLGVSIRAKNARFEVTDGGSLSNLATLTVGASTVEGTTYGSGHVFAFRGAKTKQTLFPDRDRLYVGMDSARQCRFEVTDGAQVTLDSSTQGNNRFWVGTGKAAVSNAIVVAGEGSLISGKTTSPWLIGQHGPYNRLEIRDGGMVRVDGGRVTVGQGDQSSSTADENVLLLENGGHLECSAINVGYGDTGEYGNAGGHANRNRAEILSGSTVSNRNNAVYLGYNTNSCDNVLRISDSKFFSNRMVCSGWKGSGNRIIVENGGVLTVTDGTSVRTGDNTTVITMSNRVEVLSGGVINTSGGLFLHGVGAGLTVSNGTIRSDGHIGLPDASGNRYATEPVITIAGTNSLVYSRETITIQSNAVLSVSVPAGGFLQPPFQTASGKSVTIRDLGTAAFDLTDFLSGRTVLARAGGTLTVDAASLAKMNEGLPENTIVRCSGNELVLSRNVGTTIIFR